MDPTRYGLQQGWENNSALEGYGAVHDPKFRSGSYDDRRFVDDRFPRDTVYPRNAFQRDILERDNYPPPPAIGAWPQTRRRSYEEEYPIDKHSRRHEKTPYVDSYEDLDSFHDLDKYNDTDTFQEYDKLRDGYRTVDNYRDQGIDRSRYRGRDREEYLDDYDYRPRISRQSREDSRERDYGRYSYDSDYDRGSRRDGNWRRHDSRDRDRDRSVLSRERDSSPYRMHERSRSRGHDDRLRSRSPRGRSYSRSHREDSYDDARHERSDKQKDRDEKRQNDYNYVAPSATVVVKGLSQKTTEEDLYQILAEWGPLRHVRVIKERNSGVSRGFAFIDFPSLGAARAMMDQLGDDGLVVDSRKLFFEYSKPTGGAGGPSFGSDNSSRSGHGNHKSISVSSDWMCIICGCVNFARRTSCFQCNEARTDDAPPADMASSNHAPLGRRGDTGPTHVLVVRGLDENADEDMLRYEFSKHAPIKDLRVVRDRFTHVSKGYAFVHFHSVDDATKALEATSGTTLEKNGQILRVAYAKSIIGPGSGAMQSSSLAAAAIEAATFAQQYDAVGWAPKEYNPDDKQSTGGREQSSEVAIQKDSSAPQSGFVWDETSGYYYDASSGFYYDGNTGLYYDGNNGVWYTYDQNTQQYIPCTDQNNKTAENGVDVSKASDSSNNRKVVISAPAATVTSSDKPTSLPDAVQAAAAAALAAEKKEKEKQKEIRLASKSSILASKKKMSNVLTMWKQRSHEGQAPRLALDDNQTLSAEEKLNAVGSSSKGKPKIDAAVMKENPVNSSGFSTSTPVQSSGLDPQERPKPISSGGAIRGVIRGSGRGVVKSDTYSGPSGVTSTSLSASVSTVDSSASASINVSGTALPFRTNASALGSYTPPVAGGGSKRRFSEMPVQQASSHKEQNQTTYRDRAAERRSLYGSSSFGDNQYDLETGDSDRDSAFKRVVMDSMPFPPGVGGRGVVDGNLNAQSYEVITAEKAIDENNVGNRMLRNMGWQEGLITFSTLYVTSLPVDIKNYTITFIEKINTVQRTYVAKVLLGLDSNCGCFNVYTGALIDYKTPCVAVSDFAFVWATFVFLCVFFNVQGLGKDGSGMVEPVQTQTVEKRAGLGSQPKKVDPSLEVQAGDSYRTLIQKKALARFREMS